MGKLLLLLSMMSLMFLYVLSEVSPQSPALWLASVSFSYQLIRIVLSMILLVQIFTHPPRHLVFRFVAGLIAIMVGGWAIGSTYGYQMQLADTLAFLIASLAIGITSLEYRPEESMNKKINKASA